MTVAKATVEAPSEALESGVDFARVGARFDFDPFYQMAALEEAGIPKVKAEKHFRAHLKKRRGGSWR